MSFFAFSSRRQHSISYHNFISLSSIFYLFFQVFNLDLKLSVFVCRFSRRQDSIILSLGKKSTLFLNFFKLFSDICFFKFYILYIVPFITYIYISYLIISIYYSPNSAKHSGFLPKITFVPGTTSFKTALN